MRVLTGPASQIVLTKILRDDASRSLCDIPTGAIIIPIFGMNVYQDLYDLCFDCYNKIDGNDVQIVIATDSVPVVDLISPSHLFTCSLEGDRVIVERASDSAYFMESYEVGIEYKHKMLKTCGFLRHPECTIVRQEPKEDNEERDD
jgi:hypothetical protein